MTASRVVLICLACLGLAVPTIAFAQSGAGDNQYQDPLGSTQTTQTSGTVTTQTPPPLTKTPPKPPAPSPSPSPASSTSPATATATPLANTGAEPGLLALLGLGLVLAGFGMRVRASELG
jgi:hypothetical protein